LTSTISRRSMPIAPSPEGLAGRKRRNGGVSSERVWGGVLLEFLPPCANLFATTIAVFAVACADGSEDEGYQPSTGADASATDPCHGITYAGTCDGTTVTWCENGQVHSTNCKQAGYAGCQFSAGTYDCYGKGAGAFAACKTSCVTACRKVPCTSQSLPGMTQCAADREFCEAVCPCSCYAASPTGIPTDQMACSTACGKICSRESAKCTMSCSGGGGCGSKCMSAYTNCVSSYNDTCY